MEYDEPMKQIYLKILKLIHKHLNENGGVVCEIGDIDYGYKYVFVDIGLGLGYRKSIDNAKKIFMNECMNILLEIKELCNLETPLETIDDHFKCSKFICEPGCSCGTRGDESQIRSENCQKIDQMFLDDIQ